MFYRYISSLWSLTNISLAVCMGKIDAEINAEVQTQMMQSSLDRKTGYRTFDSVRGSTAKNWFTSIICK